MGHLNDCRPIVITDTKAAADGHPVICPIGKSNARADVVFAAMEDLAARSDHNVCRQGRARQTRRVSADTAQRRQLLKDVIARVEIKVAGLDAALQPHRSLSAIGRNHAAIVPDAVVHRQVTRHLPAVLQVCTANSAWALREKNVALVLGVGIVKQEVGQPKSRLGTDLRAGYTARGIGVAGEVRRRRTRKRDGSLTQLGSIVDLIPAATCLKLMVADCPHQTA